MKCVTQQFDKLSQSIRLRMPSNTMANNTLLKRCFCVMISSIINLKKHDLTVFFIVYSISQNKVSVLVDIESVSFYYNNNTQGNPE